MAAVFVTSILVATVFMATVFMATGSTRSALVAAAPIVVDPGRAEDDGLDAVPPSPAMA